MTRWSIHHLLDANGQAGAGDAGIKHVIVQTVAGHHLSWYLAAMKLAEVEHEALALPERERASLAAKLLDTLPPPGTDVSDEEVERRERQLESGEVAAVLHEEFVRRVQRERGR